MTKKHPTNQTNQNVFWSLVLIGFSALPILILGRAINNGMKNSVLREGIQPTLTHKDYINHVLSREPDILNQLKDTNHSWLPFPRNDTEGIKNLRGSVYKAVKLPFDYKQLVFSKDGVPIPRNIGKPSVELEEHGNEPGQSLLGHRYGSIMIFGPGIQTNELFKFYGEDNPDILKVGGGNRTLTEKEIISTLTENFRLPDNFTGEIPIHLSGHGGNINLMHGSGGDIAGNHEIVLYEEAVPTSEIFGLLRTILDSSNTTAHQPIYLNLEACYGGAATSKQIATKLGTGSFLVTHTANNTESLDFLDNQGIIIKDDPYWKNIQPTGKSVFDNFIRGLFFSPEETTIVYVESPDKIQTHTVSRQDKIISDSKTQNDNFKKILEGFYKDFLVGKLGYTISDSSGKSISAIEAAQLLPDITHEKLKIYNANSYLLAVSNHDLNKVRDYLEAVDEKGNKLIDDIDYFYEFNYKTALCLASECGYDDIVSLLLTYPGIKVNGGNNDYRPLYASAHNGFDKVVRLLLAHPDIEVNFKRLNGDTALHAASENGNVDVVKMLLEHGIDINEIYDGKTALHIASQNGHAGAAKILLENGIDIKAVTPLGSTALHLACHKGHAGVAQILLEHGIDIKAINNDGATALHAAAQHGHLDLVKILLAKAKETEFDINARDNLGNTILDLAAMGGFDEVVRILLAHPGIDVNLKRINGITALHIASHKGYAGAVKILLEHGMDIKAVTPLGSTALHLAAQKGHAGVANILLEHGIDIKAVTNEGATALHVAAKYGHLGVVEILLAKANHEFDINAMDNFYNTVLDLAALGGHIEIVNTFLGQSNEYNIDKDIISRALAIAEQEYSKTQSPQYKQICDELDYYELQRATQFNIRINNPREISPCIEPKIAEEIEKNISELDKETLITQAPLNQDLNKDDIIQGL